MAGNLELGSVKTDGDFFPRSIPGFFLVDEAEAVFRAEDPKAYMDQSFPSSSAPIDIIDRPGLYNSWSPVDIVDRSADATPTRQRRLTIRAAEFLFMGFVSVMASTVIYEVSMGIADSMHHLR